MKGFNLKVSKPRNRRNNSRVKVNRLFNLSRPHLRVGVFNNIKVNRLKLSKPMKGIPSGSFSRSKYAKMNWKQVKKRFPGLNPQGDVDFDGTRNKFDCRPLDPSKDGRFSDFVKKVGSRVSSVVKALPKAVAVEVKRIPTRVEKKLKSYEPKKVKSKAVIIRQAAGKLFNAPKKKSGVKRDRPGRPAGVYIHTSPLTGKRVPATVYYKHKKIVRRKFKETSEQQLLREQAVLARRGIPPQLTKDRQEARLQEFQGDENDYKEEPAQTPEEVQVQPEEIQPEVSAVPHQPQYYTQPKYRVVTDIMTGRKLIKPIPPKEAWLQ